MLSCLKNCTVTDILLCCVTGVPTKKTDDGIVNPKWFNTVEIKAAKKATVKKTTEVEGLSEWYYDSENEEFYAI